jgi:hypothetical protein
MKLGASPNDLGPCVEGKTPLCLDLLQRVDIAEIPVGQRLVGQRPEALGGLKCGRIRGYKMQVQARGPFDLRAPLPSDPIEPQQHVLAGSRPDGLGERGEGDGERGHRDREEQQPDRVAGAGMHKGIEIAPVVAMQNHRAWMVPAGTPDTTHDRLEAEAVWVGGPPFDAFLGVCLRQGTVEGTLMRRGPHCIHGARAF